MTKKQKSAAKLAAEASDKLDALEDAMHNGLDKLSEKFDAAKASVRERCKAKQEEIYYELSDEATAKLHALRAEIGEFTDISDLGDGHTHLRDVMP